METLHTTLLQMKSTLEELDAIMVAEANQLDRPQINPVALQVLTDSKSQLLATLQHHDEMRIQQETRLAIAAPYPHRVQLFVCWQQITERVRRSKALNSEVESRLQHHLEKTQRVQKVVDQLGHHHTLYGSDGESGPAVVGRKYDISV
ncbi:flagellar export chaperone FlgN [Pantoea sp. EABMAA-21]|uniref:flagella synthesis protein FlgN n=1 Tax=Pantoea sp. EABMAA-21 TaxID=3043302 RepID=UPI0024B559CF|nr:flagellar export chaperone FlgN [Pantoea sp. EABMAA-21]MDI9279073.1 flagellar export chaperone FlgN [Pantoea sp. EABMAA-21]